MDDCQYCGQDLCIHKVEMWNCTEICKNPDCKHTCKQHSDSCGVLGCLCDSFVK